MLVSAISANYDSVNKNTGTNCCASYVRIHETIGETAFNSLTSNGKKNSSIEKLGLYESINEWKEFCHKQILNGKLDVIA